MVTSLGREPGGGALDQLAAAALSTLTRDIEIPGGAHNAGETALGLFQAFTAVHDAVKSTTSRDSRNNINDAPNIGRDLEPFLRTVERLSGTCSDNTPSLPHDKHRQQTIAMKRLRLATVQANIFVAAHGNSSLGNWRGGSPSLRSETDRNYAEALALQHEIDLLETYTETSTFPQDRNEAGPLLGLQSQVETLMSEKVDRLVQERNWADATTQLRLLVNLKVSMIHAYSKGDGNLVTDPVAKEMRVQLSKYEKRLGSVLDEDGNATEAEQLIRKVMEQQKFDLGVNDEETRDSISKLCEILIKSDNEERRYEGERLLFLESHRPNPDEIAMRCATRLGKSYIDHQNYLDARATFVKLWNKQRQQGCEPAMLLSTAEQILVVLTRQSASEEAMQWRRTLWSDYPQDFSRVLPSDALILGGSLVRASRWDEARPILRRLWEDVQGCSHRPTSSCSCPACAKTERWFNIGLLYSYSLNNEYAIANNVLSLLWQARNKAPRSGWASVFRLADQHTQVLEQSQNAALELVCQEAWQTVKSVPGYANHDAVMTLGSRYARCLLAKRKGLEAANVAREVYRMRRALMVTGNEESRRKAHQSCQLLIDCLNSNSIPVSLASLGELGNLRAKLVGLNPVAPRSLLIRRLNG